MAKEKIWLSSPTMHTEELAYIREAFDKNWVAPLGFNCDGFEEETVDYLKSKGGAGDLYALSLCSGTAALHLAVKLAGVQSGDTVFCSDMTFSATVNPVSYEGGRQVFIDAEPETWNMDPAALERAFEKYPNTKLVIMAHLYGTPGKMAELTAICEKHGAILIEDAAEALSAAYRGKACGSFGDYGVLSYNGNKIITTSGGGMLLTKTVEARKKALFWATQSREPCLWYEHKEIGYNYRMSDIVAGIGRGQMKHLEEHRARKEKLYHNYAEAFKGLPVQMNPHLEDSVPNYWLSAITVEPDAMKFVTPETIQKKLAEQNIESRPIWKPMHLQPVFRDRDFIGSGVAEDIFARGLCLPSDIKMTKAQQAEVIEIIKGCF